jgi:hypothetical protein
MGSQLPPRPFTCVHCGRILAETDGQRLWVGRAWLQTRTKLYCQCGETRIWIPLDNGKASPQTIRQQ